MEQIRELTFWKQTATEQSREWETTVVQLEKQKVQQVATLTQYERQIHSIQRKLDVANEWRQRAIEQAESLIAMIMRLEKEMTMTLFLSWINTTLPCCSQCQCYVALIFVEQLLQESRSGIDIARRVERVGNIELAGGCRHQLHKSKSSLR